MAAKHYDRFLPQDKASLAAHIHIKHGRTSSFGAAAGADFVEFDSDTEATPRRASFTMQVLPIQAVDFDGPAQVHMDTPLAK